MTNARPRTLLVEGWRGINHSYALANQYQLLEMLKLPGLSLVHRDLPFAFPHWNRGTNPAGFSAEDLARIDGIPAPGMEPIDSVFRIAAPFRSPAPQDSTPTVTFMITELGLTPACFVADADPAGFTRDANRIVTSTPWSRDRLAEWGYSPDRIDIVPLGVDTGTFYPVTAAEREANRAAIGLHPHETVFLNIGIPAWNKGIDLLLRAFATLRAAGRPVRLVLKDQREVYGVKLDETIARVAATCPDLVREDTLRAMLFASGTLSRERLRLLYGAADAYVSPYRAEGFNLPVLEAIACGTHAIVTDGGATDGFCPPKLATRVPGDAGVRPTDGPVPARFIEPQLDALIEAMDAAIGARTSVDTAAARDGVLAHFNWPVAARRVAEIAVGLPGATIN